MFIFLYFISMDYITFNCEDYIFFNFRNVNSSTSHKKTPSLQRSLREFKKSLLNIFIYESILIIIYVNANIMNIQIFHLFKYDLFSH